MLACSLLVACSDYQQGYQDGYQGKAAGTWCALGGEEYNAGYIEGQMQQAHDDWYAQNEADIDEGMSCPAVTVGKSPVVVTRELGIVNLGNELHGDLFK